MSYKLGEICGKIILIQKASANLVKETGPLNRVSIKLKEIV